MSTLLAIRGPHTGVRFKLSETDSTSLGRSTDCDIPLLDSQISRIHAHIRRQGHTWIVRDNGSRNGVIVNGEKALGEKVLLQNDEIQMGSSLFLFDSDFDLQNATFSNKSVYLAGPYEDTVKAPLATASSSPPTISSRQPGVDQDSLLFLQKVGEALAPGVGPMAEALPGL